MLRWHTLDSVGGGSLHLGPCVEVNEHNGWECDGASPGLHAGAANSGSGVFWNWLRSWPQAAAASRPRVLRTLTGTPRRSSAATNCCTALRLGRLNSEAEGVGERERSSVHERRGGP